MLLDKIAHNELNISHGEYFLICLATGITVIIINKSAIANSKTAAFQFGSTATVATEIPFCIKQSLHIMPVK